MIKFGPSGNCEAFYEAGFKETWQEPAWLFSLGLNAFEYSFGLGKFLKDETAQKIGDEAKKFGVEVSVHAPYYINFANESEKSLEYNPRFLFDSLRNLKSLGGRHCVVHLGSQMKLKREVAIKNIKNGLASFLEEKKNSEYADLIICPETMGRYSQIGTFEEIFDICTMDDCLIPTLDFGHINCVMQGELKTREDFERIFKYGIDKIGYEKMKDVHIHFSKIMYGPKGEIRHLTFEDEKYGPKYKPFLEAIYKLDLEPVIICESSGTQAPDAKTMKDYFYEISKK